MYNSIVLHVPHASANFSFAGKSVTECYESEWLEYAKGLIDWYTDELFVPESINERIIPVVFDTCRTLCDVERMSHDPLEARGLGITYYPCLMTRNGAYNPRLVPEDDSKVMQKYLDHQYKLASLLVQHHGSLLLDCHSFSSAATLLQPDAAKNKGIDICLGWNDDFTKPSDEILFMVEEYFKDRGYSVGLNTPYSNAKTVDTPADYNALMIEVNKKLYMDETTLERSENFSKVKADIHGLYGNLTCCSYRWMV